MSRYTTQDEEIGEDVDDIGASDAPIDSDRQALARKFIDDVEHAVLSTVMAAALHEVVPPDVIRALGA